MTHHVVGSCAPCCMVDCACPTCEPPATLTVTFYDVCHPGDVVARTFTRTSYGSCAATYSAFFGTISMAVEYIEASCSTKVTILQGGCIFASSCRHEETFYDPDGDLWCNPIGLELPFAFGNCDGYAITSA